MKKFISLALAFIMIFAFCCCGIDATQPADAPVVEATPLKFGLICLHDENSTYDLNFINAFNAACEATGVTGIIKTGIGENADCFEAASQLADEGCNLVFADSFGHEDYIVQAAKDYPNVEFCHATGTVAHTEGLSNFHNAFAAIYQGRYIDGIAAGMKLNEMITSGELAEDEAKQRHVMTMKDWIEVADDLLKYRKKSLRSKEKAK